VRRGRQKLGIQSDSSYRFERGVDVETVESASRQAAGLIRELTGGSCALAKSSGLPKIKKQSINLSVSTAQKILGVNITTTKIKKILNGLGFKTKAKAKNSFRVVNPAHRPDVELEIDLIEEIARIFGYDNIPTTLPAVEPQVSADQQRILVSAIKNILTGLGLNEVITYSLMDKDLLRSFRGAQADQAIEILNPLSQEQGILRPQLMPSLAVCLAYNLNQKQEYVNIFEIAHGFSASNSGPKEELLLGMALCGVKPLLLEQGLIKDTAEPLHLKGICETLFVRLGARDYSFKTADNADRISVYVAGEEIGFIAGLKKNILDSLGIKNKEVIVAELNLSRLLSYADLNKKFIRLAVYPGISRDISLFLKEETLAGDVLEAIKEQGSPLLRQVKVIDYYKGKQIPAGFKGFTISCFYRRDERTLTEAEINPLHSAICDFLTKRFAAQIR